MSDLISRADAIEAMWKALYAYQDITEKQFQANEELDLSDWFQHRIFVQRMHEECMKAVNSLPSAHAEWIPCSERLPSESGDYLCTIPLDAYETYTEVLTFHKGRFYEDDDEWGATYHDDVLAWMPLPTQYREENEE